MRPAARVCGPRDRRHGGERRIPRERTGAAGTDRVAHSGPPAYSRRDHCECKRRSPRKGFAKERSGRNARAYPMRAGRHSVRTNHVLDGDLQKSRSRAQYQPIAAQGIHRNPYQVHEAAEPALMRPSDCRRAKVKSWWLASWRTPRNRVTRRVTRAKIGSRARWGGHTV